MDRVDRHTVLMLVANTIGLRSVCERAKVGAVIARNSRILVTGYNGPPSGAPHCDVVGGCTEAERNNGCKRSVHAEANAIAFAARYGISIQGAELYCKYSPCFVCCQLIANTGLDRVYYQEEYRDTSGITILREAGIEAYKHG